MKLSVRIVFLVVTLPVALLKPREPDYILVEDGWYDCAEENSNESKKKSLKGWKPTPFSEIKYIADMCYDPDIDTLLTCFYKETYVIDYKGCFLIPRALAQEAVFELNKSFY